MNELSDINGFENTNFKNLEKLDLSKNRLYDIDVFEKVNFLELKELNLGSNFGYDYGEEDFDITKLKNFKYLEKLNLSNTNISDISMFKNVKFHELEE